MKTIIYLSVICLVSACFAPRGARGGWDGEPDVHVMNSMGDCFENAVAEGACWSAMLSEKNPANVYDFGVHYVNGDGTGQNLLYGRYWIHRAALAGYPLAQYNLGVMFFDGFGGVQSPQCAKHWLHKSSLASEAAEEVASESRRAISAIESQDSTMPRVFPVRTGDECEQLPDVVFASPMTESSPLMAGTVAFDNSFVLPRAFVAGLRAIVLNETPAEPSILFHPSLHEHVLDGGSEPVEVLREKLGYALITLGETLLTSHGTLREAKANKLDMCEHATAPSPAPSTRPAAFTSASTSVSSASGDIDAIDAEATEEPISPSEPLFVARLLDTPVMPSHAKLDVMAARPSTSTSEMDAVMPETAVSSSPAPLTAAKSTAQATPTVLNLGGDLRRADKKHYTLQLGSASQPEALLATAKQHHLTNYVVYETQRNGREWYVLVYGEYQGMSQAKQALQRLPTSLKQDAPWIRSLAHVQSELSAP